MKVILAACLLLCFSYAVQAQVVVFASNQLDTAAYLPTNRFWLQYTINDTDSALWGNAFTKISYNAENATYGFNCSNSVMGGECEHGSTETYLANWQVAPFPAANLSPKYINCVNTFYEGFMSGDWYYTEWICASNPNPSVAAMEGVAAQMAETTRAFATMRQA